MKLRQLAIVSSLLLTTFAIAGPACGCHKLSDTINLPIVAQKWVSTDSAKVTVSVDATLQANQLASVQSELLKKFHELAPAATWHITALDRSLNASGLLQVHAQAQARLKGQPLSQIQAKVKQLSHAGMTYKVNQVDFTPSFAEMQKARVALRMDVYEQVKQEMTRLHKVFPAGEFTIGKINFNPQLAQHAAGRNLSLVTFGGSASNASQTAAQVSNRMQIQAQVVLHVSAK